MFDLANIHLHLLTCACHGERFLRDCNNQLMTLAGVWEGDNKAILDRALSHFNLYSKPIGTMILGAVKTKDAEVLNTVADPEYYRNTTVEAVEESLNNYVRKEVILQRLHQLTSLVVKGDFDAVFTAFDHIRRSCDFTPIDSHTVDMDNYDALAKLLEAYSEKGLAKMREFTYGIDAMDTIGQRPYRSQVQGWLGQPNTGKTWHAVHFARVNADRGHNCLIITTEAPEHEIALRYATMVTNLPLRKVVHPLLVIDPDQHGYVEGMRVEALPGMCKVEDLPLSLLTAARGKLAARKGKIKIKAFAPSSATAKDVAAFIDKEADAGVKYDLVVLDHLKFMKYKGSFEDSYFIILEYVLQFLSIAIKNDLAFVFFHQPSQAPKDDVSNGVPLTFRVNSSMAKHVLEPLGAAYTLNATPAEARRNLVRVYVEKTRSPDPASEVGAMLLSSNVYPRGIISGSSAVMRGISIDPAQIDAAESLYNGPDDPFFEDFS